MRAFIVCLAIAAVSGDAKPYTVAQVAAGLPVLNALADGRAHNVGVITNAVEAGVKTVGAVPLTYSTVAHVPSVYSGYPHVAGVYSGYPNVAGVYSGYPYGVHAYGKREAEANTIAQVAHGQIAAGGVVTGISYGHGTGLIPATAVAGVHAGVYSAYPHVAGVYSGYPYGIHTYGKREAEANTIAQVAHGQIAAGGVVTGISYGHGTGLIPATAVAGVHAGVYSAYPYGVVPHVAGYPYGVHGYGKREAEPYTLEQVAHGKTAGGVVTGIDYGHGTGGLRPATAVQYTHVPAVYSHVPAVHAAVPAVYSTAYSFPGYYY